MWVSGLLTDDQFRDSMAAFRAQETALLATLDEGQPSPLTPEMVRAGWDALDLAAQRAIVNRFAKVLIDPAPKGRPPGWVVGQPYFHPNAIRVLTR